MHNSFTYSLSLSLHLDNDSYQEVTASLSCKKYPMIVDIFEVEPNPTQYKQLLATLSELMEEKGNKVYEWGSYFCRVLSDATTSLMTYHWCKELINEVPTHWLYTMIQRRSIFVGHNDRQFYLPITIKPPLEPIIYYFQVVIKAYPDGRNLITQCLDMNGYGMLKYLSMSLNTPEIVETIIVQLESVRMGATASYVWGSEYCYVYSEKTVSTIEYYADKIQSDSHSYETTEISTELLWGVLKGWKVFLEQNPIALYL